MLSFASDYATGAHPAVLARLIETNGEPLHGYGEDRYTGEAADLIRGACGSPDAAVFFVAGGTQANQLVIGTMTDGGDGVFAAATGHISAHEAGAVEYTGHKVLVLPGTPEGKLTAETIKNAVSAFQRDENRDHMVSPGMVYLSFPTEYGTLYSKAELTAIYDVCRSSGLVLFIDGARLAYGLASLACDLTLPELASLCDVFTVGGTKAGALCGEAVVFPRRQTVPRRFFSKIKQHGALMAKGRLTGVQFAALFSNGLYAEIGRHANEMARKMVSVFREKGYRFLLESPTNQQFVILDNEQMAELGRSVSFSFWEAYDEHRSVVRFATAWSTTENEIDALRGLL